MIIVIILILVVFIAFTWLHICFAKAFRNADWFADIVYSPTHRLSNPFNDWYDKKVEVEKGFPKVDTVQIKKEFIVNSWLLTDKCYYCSKKLNEEFGDWNCVIQTKINSGLVDNCTVPLCKECWKLKTSGNKMVR